ncbi:MAG: phospho-N-acetylmuramoyl-pentapeptide-transferase [Thermoflexales bacterium]|nr:phospho-N-acetylmuramoyl-pentapeptide-transferase [Thermoflexales bacterium]MCS7325564.1 phospho-N-acetylmuramoyl-pentapeptide-transferase [Thermoflexales bacterium]MCX7937954.1 phospho-N-acetylmuramoyl-pentapeptide-transferase [Thermoflexales bacterium]MDW8054636.1 phospho-N-acetylmuramoyl-pentapeptide-transferase [Anaerolineae bacterium]MDW8292970.1 phospho-N-acetylmuramoyl-pentapeptide-transferase [Anaerolineae bacterium]
MSTTIAAPQMGVSLIAGGVAFLMALALAPVMIRLLKRFGIGKRIRMDGPASHYVKMGTPTMGGVIFIVPTLVLIGAMYLYTRIAVRIDPALVPFVLVGNSIAVPVFVMVSFALLGAVDDYMGVRGVRRGEGMRGRSKFLVQLVIALVAAVVMNQLLGINRLGLPGVGEPVALGAGWIPIAVFIILASANAVNLTDGLDGLAALISGVAFVAYGVIAYMQGQVFLTMLCMVLVGAMLGFLWFNVHPAQVFMGDLGSEALGAVLGVVALMTGQWLLLPVIAIIPLAETLAVILQVAYFKFTKRRYGEGKRLFKMSPLHNHFVLLGWSEPQIVQRFFVVALFFGMLGIGLATFGNPPAELARGVDCSAMALAECNTWVRAGR